MTSPKRIFRCKSLLLAAVFTALVVDAAPRPANILIIVADDLGWSDVGCYGGEIQTPNLDRLANKGLCFTRLSNTSRCRMSRASILTGYHPQACLGIEFAEVGNK